MNQLNLKIILIIFAFGSIASLLFSNVALAEVIPPKKQTELKIDLDEIICNDGFFKIIKASTNTAACVKPSTAEKLVKAGWAKAVDQALLDAAKKRVLAPIGTVTILATLPIPGDAGKFQTTQQVTGYNVIFEACAKEIMIRIPEVVISSDSEAKSIKLADKILPNTCQTSAAKIKVSNPDSIKATLFNKGELSKKINSLEATVTTMKEQLASTKSDLAIYVNQDPQPSDIKQKVAEATNKIVELRKNLNNAKAELERYFFGSYVKASSVTKGSAILSFSGQPVEGGLVNVLATTQQLASTEKPFGYNVVFEACAGPNIVRAPLVEVTSDLETKGIKLADKISPNSCQIGTAKITADNTDSITVMFANTGDVSDKVAEIDTKIADLQKMVQSEKQSLNALTHLAPRPADFNEQAIALSEKIIDLRNQVNDLKTQLHSILFGFYEN